MIENYADMAAIIRSGQVSHDEAQKIIDSDPEFAKWYRKKYLMNRDEE